MKLSYGQLLTHKNMYSAHNKSTQPTPQKVARLVSNVMSQGKDQKMIDSYTSISRYKNI